MNSFPSSPKRIALVTDAWAPQVNGVVRTLSEVVRVWQSEGHEVRVFSPDQFRSVPCPTYPEIRLAIDAVWKLPEALATFSPDALHIATEGPLGLVARLYAAKKRWGFTTSYHTKFPEYIAARFGVGETLAYRYLRWFHNESRAMMVATKTMRDELEGKGFTQCHDWMRGVDTALFHPTKRIALPYPSPILLYVGRVAVEKNIEAFLQMKIAGSKIVVGDGPARSALATKYPDAQFLGLKEGEELAMLYASADLFVFPSKTDTFGLVMLEALASGTPVAAYPVTGPIDVLKDEKAAVMNADLTAACTKALTLKREDCRAYAAQFSWAECAKRLEAALYPIQ